MFYLLGHSGGMLTLFRGLRRKILNIF
jgi:hypothetical protein